MNQERAIELVQAQIAGIKKEIADLTGQLVPGTSDARENVINDQISAASDRLESLQEQLDRLITGEPFPGTTQPPFVPPDPNDIPAGVQSLLEMGLAGAVLVALGLPIVRLIARRLEPRPRVDPTADPTPRFDRIEQAMDAVAIEVERISEGQRYTNKVLADLKALPAPNPVEQWPLKARAEEKLR
ncbi:MAG: hypothetical protein IT361_00515 [Gemmatimonadaceae bacterium]|nr:hypothetical protein [Gemmatimonadaceae bacterium]